jgi:alkylation response protein AidB-like acyl-CoA dehydrogenase
VIDEQRARGIAESQLIDVEIEVHGVGTLPDTHVRSARIIPPMDLTPTDVQEATRAECRQWLKDELPWEYGVGLPPRFDDLADEVAFGRTWQQKLAAARFVGVTWPDEYGGRGAGPLEHYVVQEELARARAPELVGRIGVNLVGPTLLAHGTDDQKTRWLPRILDASELWCQLFSEPGAGSDLAGLTTRAERVEGGWLLTGQKVWTSYAQFADWGLCLARTTPVAPDVPKQRGITAFALEMRADGVDVRPLVQATGEAEFNEVFLDGAFVADEHAIGAVDDGWRVTGSTLTHERGTNPRQLVIHAQLIEELLRLALEVGADRNPRLMRRVSQAWVEVKLFQLHNWRSLSKLAKGAAVGPEGSALKLYWSEMSQRLHATAMEVLGPAAPLWRGADANPGDGRWQRSWLYYRAASIFAGTNEIQRNVIGERVLGLPRS